MAKSPSRSSLQATAVKYVYQALTEASAIGGVSPERLQAVDEVEQLAAKQRLRIEVRGAGTLIYPLYSKWASAYPQPANLVLNYRPLATDGSAEIHSQELDYSTTDQPLDSKQLQSLGLVQFPILVTGVVPIVNLPSLQPGDLVLDGPTLAAIYRGGEIVTWTDPRIQQLNPSITLPSERVTPV